MGILLKIAYDGSNYAGWQRQKNAITISQTLEEALQRVFSVDFNDFNLLGASRTDAGVHALGQCAHVRFTENTPECKIPARALPRVINANLPKDIVVVDAIFVDDNFHPINDVVSKTYQYCVVNAVFSDPRRRNTAWHISHNLNFDAMTASCQHFIGRHDFAAFCASGSVVKSTIRCINSLDLSLVENRNIGNIGGVDLLININGDGFLYNMVRIIAGTLVEIGEGKIVPNDIPSIIKSKNRKTAGRTAPACGLTLMEIFYS
ncbi:MAG: tRNA pseudouridine(38-40) synthase TruA [Defluviitaleaceae bacterium]|nr:tRNA pseudouridine(38-40) synthase TruA [Defluviitaleaceae bacterium]